MAEGRMISRRITRSEKVAALKSDTSRMIYTWIIPFLDVEGRLEVNIELLKADIAPLLKHITCRGLMNILVELHNIGLIVLYTIKNKEYLQLTQFDEHQKNLRKDKESPCKIPAPTPESLRTYSGPSPDLRPPKIKRIEDKEKIKALALNSGYCVTWELFVDHREEINKPLTEKACTLIFDKLEKWKNEKGWSPKDILNQSIENGWTGIYEIKVKSSPKNKVQKEYRVPESKVEFPPDLTPEERQLGKQRARDLLKSIGRTEDNV